MKNMSDLLADQRGRFDEGRTALARIQNLFDAAFGAKTCLVKLGQTSMVVYVQSAALATEVQMQKHTLVKEIQALEPGIRSVRITIGLPRPEPGLAG